MTNKLIPLPKTPIYSIRVSHDQNENYRAPSLSFDIEAAGRNGSATLEFRVAGYWSDVITLRIGRKGFWCDDEQPTWSCSLSHSSGGRMTSPDEKHYPSEYYTAIADDLEAETNFGIALIETAQLGREILKHSEALEAFYQQKQAERRAQEAQKAAERQARIDADVLLGDDAAKRMIEQAKEIVTRYQPSRIAIFPRGSDAERIMECRMGQVARFYLSGSAISIKEALSTLAASSHRSRLLPVA